MREAFLYNQTLAPSSPWPPQIPNVLQLRILTKVLSSNLPQLPELPQGPNPFSYPIHPPGISRSPSSRTPSVDFLALGSTGGKARWGSPLADGCRTCGVDSCALCSPRAQVQASAIGTRPAHACLFCLVNAPNRQILCFCLIGVCVCLLFINYESQNALSGVV